MVMRRGAGRSGCLTYLLLIAAALYIGLPVGEAYLRYAQYKDAMRQEVRFRANLPNAKIRSHLAIMADSLGLPPEAGDVTVTRNGNEITVDAEYDEVIRLLGLSRSIHFQPRATDTY